MNTPLRLAMVRGLLVSNLQNVGELNAPPGRGTKQIFEEHAFAGLMSCVESKSVSRILYSTFRFEISNLIFRKLKSESRVAIIPLAQTLPFGSSDLPGGCERAARLK